VAGTFNDWQRPGHAGPEPEAFVPLTLHRGYWGAPNTWLGVAEQASAGDEYKFFVEGGVGRDHKGRDQRFSIDPYARRLASDFRFNNPVVEDPTTFEWRDTGWRTPDVADLVLYELSVHGFTDADPDIPADTHGRFAGVSNRLEAGYFEHLGVNALSLMPLAEVPSAQGPSALGYDPSLYFTVERDFGTPDDLRTLVDTAHRHGVAVLVDLVFNHTSNDFNPLWGLVLQHPSQETGGGLYFNGSTPWGNRVATERPDVQHMLIDACRCLLTEFHVDGFRFDATHRYYMDHGFLQRLAREVRADKPDTILIAENLPNEPDLNLEGWNGYAQWCELFHDKLKALLREGPFEGESAGPERLGEAFYFSKTAFAAHTNNVVNYVESHDEHSITHELRHTLHLNHPAAKERKGRLGVFATIVALGQPMLYMGQEFNEDRPRNLVTVDWPDDLDSHGFFQWCRRLLRLRLRYPGLRLRGHDPAAGQFEWILAPWLDRPHGGDHRVIGWRARPGTSASDELVVLLNLEPWDVAVELELGRSGRWVKLADIDRVNDIPPEGTNSAADATALESRDGRFAPFTLPSSCGFVYKWESPLQ
jgi:1,4-alpha-glucan branching enzyme